MTSNRPALAHRRAAPLRQAGFTLVELVTVILILGVLAAVALPRYADLQGKARESKVKAVAGSLKAASGMVKASAMANGKSCGDATDPGITMEGMTVALNHCYPQALSAFSGGVLGAANVSAADGWAVSGTAGEGGGTAAASVLVIQLGDATTPASCAISYTSAANVNTPPVISTTTTGC